ncbi:UNVERIFIED_CONTAM: hypothetical protein PYX00_010636 [Menopon gallinae]|uniref:F-box domain-containing protein n=1 Tax=Menopon gallinae TaxID=328185 RepID=A0AAW2HG22_9NEOP
MHKLRSPVNNSKMDGQQSYSQRILNLPLKKVEVQKLIERDIKEEEEIHFIQQFVNEVLDFSSQYGSDTSISYTAYNLTGKPSKFPDYGDFPQAFVMKTYGNWWKESPSYSLEYMPQNTPKIASNDYVDVAFEQKVYPFTVSIYETYNPGSVVRIWAKNDASVKKKWTLLWEGEPVNVGHVPRMFSPPIKIINFKTSVLRIEFNHSKLEYYTGIDAVLMVGTGQPIRTNISNSSFKFLNSNVDENKDGSGPIILGKITQQVMKLNLHNIPRTLQKTDLQAIVAEFQKKKNSFENGKCEGNYNGYFHCLPNETILKILSYLDLSSLRCCAQLNRHFLSLCNDSFLYTRLSLRPYWSKITDDALMSLTKKSQYLQQLDLSWCGSYDMITSAVFKKFLTSCCENLTHVRLNCCKFVTNCVLKVLAETCSQLKEIALRNCSAVTEAGFFYLSGLSTLENLDLYRTNITINSLIAILKANRNILHLNIGNWT